MKRLATLTLAVILITGCNAMKPNMEETELLSKEIEKRIYAQAWPTETPTIKESKTTPALIIVKEKEDEARPVPTDPAEEPKPAAPETTGESKEIPLQPEELAETTEWPYITCPPELEWPYITAPEPPTYTPEPEIIEPTPAPEPTPTPQPTPAVPAVPADPVDPAPQPTAPTPEPTSEPAQTGYAQCFCGARLTPDELVPHMKAHALNGESHSYRAY